MLFQNLINLILIANISAVRERYSHDSLIIGNVEATHLPSAEYSIFLGFYFKIKIVGTDVGH